ncbi:hypothetical protein SH611_04285 [Geminicoccaceae bacterium 1502E]|nr:hypothetical protein [Geminicoccaceae bacterium 1502E]
MRLASMNISQAIPWHHRSTSDTRRPGGPDPFRLVGLALVLGSSALTVAGWIFFFSGLASF